MPIESIESVYKKSLEQPAGGSLYDEFDKIEKGLSRKVQGDQGLQIIDPLQEGAKDIIKSGLGFARGGAELFKEVYGGPLGDVAQVGADALKDIDILSPDPDYIKSEGLRGYAEDVLRMAPQIGTQAAIALSPAGPIASAIFMGSQIAGGKYERLRDEDVPIVRSVQASFADAALQTPFEYIGISKAMKFWKPGKKAMSILRGATEAGSTEFLTEAIQQYPELATDIWAKSQDIPVKDQVNEFVERFGEATKAGLYEGAVALPFGLLLGGAGVAVTKQTVDPAKALSSESIESEIGKVENDQFLDDVIAGKDEVAEPFQDIEEQTQNLPPIVESIGEKRGQLENALRDEGIAQFEQNLSQAQEDIQDFTIPEVKPEITPAAEEIIAREAEAPKQPITEPTTEKTTPTIPEGKKIVHEMSDGSIMDGPAHEGALPGSEKIVDDLESQKVIKKPEVKETRTDKEKIQFVEDTIETMKRQGRDIPKRMIQKLAELKGTIKPGSKKIVSRPVFGHPEATSVMPQKYGNLIPIIVSDVASVEKRLEKTQKLVDTLQRRVMKRKGIKSLSFEEEGILELLQTETVPELSRLFKEVEKLEASKKIAQTPEQITTKLNKDLPDQDIKYDGEFDRTALKKGPLYQFTPQSGPLRGRTISVEELSSEAVKNKLDSIGIKPISEVVPERILTETKTQKQDPQTEIDEATKEIGILKRYPDLSENPKKEIAEFQKIIDDNEGLLKSGKEPNLKAKIRKVIGKTKTKVTSEDGRAYILEDLVSAIYKGGMSLKELSGKVANTLGKAYGKVRAAVIKMYRAINANLDKFTLGSEVGAISIEPITPKVVKKSPKKQKIEEQATIPREEIKTTQDIEQEPDTFTVEDNSSLIDDFQYNVVDELAPVSKVYKAIKKDIPEEIDFKLKEELRVSKTEDEISEAKEQYDRPIQKIIADSDTVNDVSDVDEYLYARHAPEANARLRLTNAKYYLNQLAKAQKGGKLKKQIEKIDAQFELANLPTKEFQEAYKGILERELQNAKTKSEFKIKKDWERFSLKPSGMTDLEAAKLTKKWAGDKDQIAIAKIFDKMNADTLKTSFDSGRMSKEEYDAVKGTFDFYAPLHREGFEKEGLFSGVSSGLKNLGKDFGIRGGSTKRAVNLLLNGIANHQKAIVNAKKAEVAKAFIEFVKSNPNKDFWDFEETKTIAAYDSQGNIKRVPARNINDGEGGNEVQIKVDGKIHVVSANPDNVHAMRIIGMIRGNKKNIGPVLGGLARMNRYLAMINTTFNPEFIISNFTRDLQTGFFNLTDTEVSGMKGKIFKSIPSTLKALHSVTRGDGKHELASMAKRYKKAGGQIGWIDYNKGIESRAKKFEGEIDLLRDGFVTKKTINSLMNWVTDYNSIVENGIRLATFKAGVDSGMSDSKAAIMAKDLTVNFNRKGALGPAINSLYLFANAGIQGSTRLFRAIKNNPKQMSKLLGSTMLAAAGMSIANSAVGGDDDEGVPYYDRIPDHVKARNMIFMLPGSTNKKLKFIKIPSPWGYNVFWAMGTEVGDAIIKKDYDPLEGAARMTATALDAFNPLQSATLLQTMSPTIADPFVMVGENKTFYGSPLAPEGNPYSKTPRPDSEKYWRSARKSSIFIAKSLNKLTGGDEVTPSKIADISPETLDLIYDTMTGGAGKFIANTLKLPGEIIKGEFELARAPFARRVIGKKSEHKVISDYKENTTHVYRLRESLKRFPKKAKKLREDRTFTLIKLAKDTDSKLRKLNKLIKITKKQDVKDKIGERKEKLRRNFNNKFNERK